MLVTLKEILKTAEENKCAIGSFNTPNMTSAEAVIAAAEELQRPVILMHAQVHEEMGLCKMEGITPGHGRHFFSVAEFIVQRSAKIATFRGVNCCCTHIISFFLVIFFEKTSDDAL